VVPGEYIPDTKLPELLARPRIEYTGYLERQHCGRSRCPATQLVQVPQ